MKSPLHVDGSWLGPLMQRFQEIAERLQADADPDVIERLIESIPALVTEMDHDALAVALEYSMGAAAAFGALDAMKADSLRGLAAEEYDGGIRFAPFEEAASALDRKTAVGSKLNSLQWGGVPAELRTRAMFSARVESARFLSEARDMLAAELRLQREKLANGQEAFLNRDVFIVRMRELAGEMGVDAGAQDGSIQDIRSSERLGLIYDINTEQAENYARYKMGMDPDVLDAWPAKRLVRVEERERKRNWRDRWRAAADEIGWQGVHRGSDMVALNTSPIWTRLGPFQNPYPPFDWGSGMGTQDVDRDEAESLGLLKPAEPVPVPSETARFNDRLESGVEDVSRELRNFLVDAFGAQVKLEESILKWIGQ